MRFTICSTHNHTIKGLWDTTCWQLREWMWRVFLMGFEPLIILNPLQGKCQSFGTEVYVTFLYLSVCDLESRHLALGFGPGHGERTVGHIAEDKIRRRLRAWTSRYRTLKTGQNEQEKEMERKRKDKKFPKQSSHKKKKRIRKSREI